MCFLLMLIVSHYSTISNAQNHFVLLLIILIDHRLIHRVINLITGTGVDEGGHPI